MSAFPPTADISAMFRHVRFVPETDISSHPAQRSGHFAGVLDKEPRDWTDGTVLQCKNADLHFRRPHVDWQDLHVARIIATMMN